MNYKLKTMEAIKAKQLISKLTIFQKIGIINSPKEWLVCTNDDGMLSFNFTNDPHRYTKNNNEIYQIDELKKQIR